MFLPQPLFLPHHKHFLLISGGEKSWYSAPTLLPTYPTCPSSGLHISMAPEFLVSQAPTPRVTWGSFVFLTPYIYFISKSSWLYHQNISHFAIFLLPPSRSNLLWPVAWTSVVDFSAMPLFPHLPFDSYHPHGVRVIFYNCKLDHVAPLFRTL